MAKILIKARGFDPDGVAEPALPAKLVELTRDADRVLTDSAGPGPEEGGG